MEQHWSTVCALLLAFGAIVHFDTASSAEEKRGVAEVPPKPAHCPRRLNVVPSRKGCTCDEDCPGEHKCCVFDCGAVCVPPVLIKPGRCPRTTGVFGHCAEFCSDDSDCPNDQKCCSNGCGHQCTTPHTVKPGRCGPPKGTPMCAEYCYHDGQCPEEQKCCKTTCGHACSEPC
ncbi:unnamed protein product [Ophioblennius macclurei]